MFRVIFRIALRNVFRNYKRSLITALAVFIGTGAIVVGRGLLNGVYDTVIGGVTEAVTGDVQIHLNGYLEATEALPLHLSFKYDESLEKLVREDPRVLDVSGRIAFSGLVTDANQENTTVFYGVGMDPDHEFNITPRNKGNIVAGQALSNDDPTGIVLGKELADNLKLNVGDEITLLVNTREGSLNGKDVKVRGIAKFRLPGLVNKAVHLPLSTAQTLLYMQGDVTEVAIKVKGKEIETVNGVNEGLTKRLAGAYPDLRSNTWLDVSSFYLNFLNMMDYVFAVLIVVFFVVMVAGIANTMLMSVLERVSEIGTMMAIGVRRKRILNLFLSESMVLGAMGAVAGTGVAFVLILYYGYQGLMFPLPGGNEGAVYPRIDLSYIVMIVGAALVVSVISALYPAWRASRLTPVDALRS